MPLFYFHLHNDVEVRDEDGRDLPSLDEARELARANARFTFGETAKDHGQVNLDHRIDIEDEHGRVLDSVYFRDAVTVLGNPEE